MRRFPGPWRCVVSAVKKYGKAVGSILSLACLAWVIYRFAAGDMAARVMHSARAGELGTRIPMAACVYGAGVVMLAIAWWFLQKTYTRGGAGLMPSVGTYLLTQLGKYLPGNVAQYVGRHLLLRRRGLGHGVLLCCSLSEAGLLAVSAVLFAAPLFDRIVPGMTAGWVVIATLVGLATACGLFASLRMRLAWLRSAVPELLPWNAVVSFGLYLSFFAIMGLTLLIVAGPEVRAAQGDGFLLAIAALSWLAGYFVIGAPAGLGVREAVFLWLFKGALPEEDILLLVAAFRVATFGGDVLAFLLAAPFIRAIRGEPT